MKRATPAFGLQLCTPQRAVGVEWGGVGAASAHFASAHFDACCAHKQGAWLKLGIEGSTDTAVRRSPAGAGARAVQAQGTEVREGTRLHLRYGRVRRGGGLRVGGVASSPLSMLAFECWVPD